MTMAPDMLVRPTNPHPTGCMVGDAPLVYVRRISNATGSVVVDIYDVLVAFGVTNPAAQHAVKKLLCAGRRGHKTEREDYLEAAIACQRAAMIVEDNEKPSPEGGAA